MADQSQEDHSVNSGRATALKPSIVFVASHKGGVGKTTLSRLLLHWLDDTRRHHVAFDTEVPFGSLVRFYPKVTELVDLAEVSAQMRVFDTLSAAEDNSVFVVDLRAGRLYQTLSLLTDLRIFKDARDGAFKVIFMHLLGDSVESVKEVEETLGSVEGAQYVVVKNPANGADLTDWETSETRRAFAQGWHGNGTAVAQSAGL